jgi:uncharacterized protein DUF6335
MAKKKAARGGRRPSRKSRKNARPAARRQRPRAKAAKARKPKARKATAQRARRPKAKARKAKPQPRKPRKTARRGGTGAEATLAQTPETGRSVKGRTNPMPTKRSTGTAAGAGSTRRAPGLERARRQLREIEETVPTPPSSLDMNRTASAARSGRAEMADARRQHTETSPVMTGGDVDADWEDAYAVGDEAPGGDNPTPDQDRVDDIGKALGIEYQDNEELRPTDKVADRDKKRWELDPASSDDYRERD